MKVLIAMSMASLFISVAPRTGDSSKVRAYRSLIAALGDDQLGFGEHLTVHFMLSKGDKDLVPLLIDNLKDTRTYNPKAMADGAPADGSVTYRKTAGEASEEILYEVLLMGEGQHNFKVADWKAWWEKHKDTPMGDIYDQVAAENKRGARAGK